MGTAGVEMRKFSRLSSNNNLLTKSGCPPTFLVVWNLYNKEGKKNKKKSKEEYNLISKNFVTPKGY